MDKYGNEGKTFLKKEEYNKILDAVKADGKENLVMSGD